uniref:Phosphatidic acid phosphatase type 2/haloperoxidase domain-containing protein n=1 Tax=Globodera rostochiensis TaxID=31243 RepID=A0A914H1J0_GLORO
MFGCSPPPSSSSSSASSVASFSPPNYRHVWNLLLSLPVLATLRAVAKSMPYARQGFFCNDNEIRYPNVSDTMPSNLLDLIFAIVSLLVVVVSECTLVRHLCRRRGRRLRLPESSAGSAALLLHPVLVNCCFFLASLYASLAATSTICELGKRTCSRLRPNFLAVYIADYECTNSMFDQNEFFSFPSGHSSSVCNFAVFIIHYLQKRFKLAPSVRSFVQFFVALFAYFVCLSRVRDHKHRLTDVAGGALIGAAVGVFFLRNVLHNFRPNRYSVVDTNAIAPGDWPDIEGPPSPSATETLLSTKLSVPRTIVVPQRQPLQQRPNDGERPNDYGSLREYVVGNGKERDDPGANS